MQLNRMLYRFPGVNKCIKIFFKEFIHCFVERSSIFDVYISPKNSSHLRGKDHSGFSVESFDFIFIKKPSQYYVTVTSKIVKCAFHDNKFKSPTLHARFSFTPPKWHSRIPIFQSHSRCKINTFYFPSGSNAHNSSSDNRSLLG